MNPRTLLQGLGRLALGIALATSSLSAQGQPPTQDQAAALRNAVSSNARPLGPVESAMRTDVIQVRDSLELARASAARVSNGARGGMLSVARSGLRELHGTCGAGLVATESVTPRMAAITIVAKSREQQGSVDRTMAGYRTALRDVTGVLRTCQQSATALLARQDATAAEYLAISDKVLAGILKYEQVTRHTLIQFSIPLLPKALTR